MIRFIQSLLRKSVAAATPAPRVAKKYPLEKPVLLSNVEGHTHLIDLADGPGGESTYALDADGDGHSHPWVQDAAGVVTIGAADGHTHTVRDPKTFDEAAKSMLQKAGKGPDCTPKRRIKYARVTHVSLVSRGANKCPVLMKSGGRVEFSMLFKVAEEEGLLMGLVYVPEENGAVDTEGDVAPRTVVKQMAHDFVANGAHLDIEHDLNVLSAEQASVAETFIVQKGDPRFQGWMDNYGQPVDATDAWGMLIKISDPGLRKAVKDGRIAGLSLFGLAEVEPIAKSTSILETMTEAELKALLDARDAQLLEAITKAVAPKAPAAPATPAAPVTKTEVKFEGDPLDLKAIQAHKEKLFLASLDMSKSEDVAKLEAYVVAKTATPAAPAAPAGSAAPSNQPAGESTPAPVAKTETDLFKSGKTFGAKINKVLGR